MVSAVDVDSGSPTAGVDCVMPQWVPITKVPEAMEIASLMMEELESIATGIQEGQYHMRIFGNSADSPVGPRFLIQNEKLTG